MSFFAQGLGVGVGGSITMIGTTEDIVFTLEEADILVAESDTVDIIVLETGTADIAMDADEGDTAFESDTGGDLVVEDC